MKNQRSTLKNAFKVPAIASRWSGRKPLRPRALSALWAAALLLPAFAASAQVALTNLYSFQAAFPNGGNPLAALAQGGDGFFYGTTSAGGTNNAGTVFKTGTDGALTILYSFTGGNDGTYPNAALVPGGDGSFYGTTAYGGTNGDGTVFKISTNGALTTLYSFTGGTDGRSPNGLTQGSDGIFYGTTGGGGSNNLGVVFKMTANGAATPLHSFIGGNEGAGPGSRLMQGTDGFFYGTTTYGGTNNAGTAFKISTNGLFASLYVFGSVRNTNGISLDGGNPNELVQGSDGSFYGTTQSGGTNGYGTVFKMSNNGVLTSLYSFGSIQGNGTPLDGANPIGGLVQGGDGYFYGMSYSGGTNYSGTVFKISASGALFTLHSFTGANDGANPYAGLVQGNDGYFYGTTEWGGPSGTGTVFRMSTNGALTLLYAFHYGNTGASPQAALVRGNDGSFYGTTSQGGTNNVGVVFKITTNGVLTYLYCFTGGSDGANPQAALVQGNDGYFYGTTPSGGTNGYGNVFRISTNGAFTSLYSFGSVQDTNGDVLDGWSPSGLAQGSDGYFYGTTSAGGTNNLGTVFKISTSGVLTRLYSFGSVQNTNGYYPLDGGNPNTALVQGADGYFYGGTAEIIGYGYGYGALNDTKVYGSQNIIGGPPRYYSTVFKISTNGQLTTLYYFPVPSGKLQAALVQGSDGYFYGTSSGYEIGYYWPEYYYAPGMVFRISTGGTLTAFASFTDNANGLMQDGDGNLYGTSSGGGANGSGYVFELSTNGTMANLYSFTGGNDGANPYAPLVQDSDGSFYGTASGGGQAGGGTVFKLTILLELFAQPQSQPIGVGNSATLSVEAAGIKPIFYQWYFDGVSLPGQTNAALLISGAAFTNAGTYYVVATNLYASVTSAVAVVMVGVPPGITAQPASLTNLLNSPAAFLVAVSGTGPFTYQWQFNGTNLPNGVINTVAGDGTSGYFGDSGTATAAEMSYPSGVAVDASGNLFIADAGNNVIRKVGTNRSIMTVAGNGTNGFSGDGGSTTAAELSNPQGVAVDTAGNLFIADSGNQRIRKVGINGTITTVAGNGTNGYSGDSSAATNAELLSPYGVAVDASGNLFIADSGNSVIRKVGTNGVITTVAGNGGYGYSGDGGAATNATLSGSVGVAVDASGNLYIADNGNNVIRKVDSNGNITTVAGDGLSGYAGDGGLATSARLASPSGVAVDASGDLFIADFYNSVIRKVNDSGAITTVAGTGSYGYLGDGGAATSAALSYPVGVALDASGDLFIADSGNNAIREVIFAGPTLGLSDLSGANAGGYDVVVSSPYGSVTSSIVNLVVLLPPTITTQPQSQAVLLGANATLTTAVAGTEPLDYQWYFDGTPLQGQTNTNLLFNGATFTNAGAYYVEVNNLYGSATSTVAIVTVGLPPGITMQPASQTNLYNSPATFSATVSGTGPFTYEWQFDGTNFPTTVGPTLVLNNLSGANAGLYDVVISSPYGSITSSIVTLVLPPTISTQPQSQTAAIGASATLIVAAAGTQPINYQWYFDGAPLADQTNTTFLISSFAYTNSGSYFAVATNFLGSATSAVAVVTVPQPPTITAQPVSQTNLFGTTASFSVSVSGTGPVAYQWQCNGTNLPPGAGATLVLPNVSVANAGLYDVVVTSPYGSVTSSNVNLVVTLPPLNTLRLNASIYAPEGLILHLQGAPGIPYVLLSATNLTPPVNWRPVFTNVASPNGSWGFIVSNIHSSPARFYRMSTTGH